MSLVTDCTGFYARSHHKPMEDLANLLSDCYNITDSLGNKRTIDTVVTSSGMNAIYSLLYCLSYNKKTEIIYPDEIYCDCPRTFAYLGLIKRSYPVGDHKRMMELLKDKNNNQKILFVESASNPNSVLFDFSLIVEIKQMGVITVIDNTWLSHLMLNPFQYEVDFVVLSLTKYYSGGQRIGGAILSDFGIPHQFYKTRVDIMNDVKQYLTRSGTHISLDYCDVISANIPTMEDKLTKSSALTEEILAYLKSQDKYKIRHSTKMNGLVCSIFTIYVNGLSKNEIVRRMKANGNLEYKTSYGGKLSRLDPFPYKDQASNCVVCRVAIGYEDTFENVKTGLDKFLA